MPRNEIDEYLKALGLPTRDLHELPSSEKRFPDGAQYRVEIPSVEGPRCLDAVLEEAVRLDVRVHRISQGSGVFLLTDAELDTMAATARQAPVELSLFARPNAAWELSSMARSPAGAVLAPTSRGVDGLAATLDDVRRAAEHGVRSVLIADLGLLYAFNIIRSAGGLPADMQAKVSVMLPAANPASARVLEMLGADTVNLPSDLTLPQLAAIRAELSVPIDLYIESPDNLGGGLRYYELPEIVRVCAPVYLKFGLRNAPDVYPSGTHLDATTIALSRERVRRARLGMELLAREYPDATTSGLGAKGLAVPVSAHSETP
jgi:hypothetical protein